MDILGSINGFFCELLATAAAYVFNLYYYIVDQISNTSFITGTLSTLFGNETVWGFVTGIHQTLVIPLAESILALFMLVQLVKISQRIDSTATLPAVKDIVFLAVTYVLMHWLIVNSLDIMSAIYTEFNNIASSGLLGSANPDGNWEPAVDLSSIEDWSGADMGACFALLIVALLSVLTGLVGYVIAIVVALARGVQIYVMATFSPIPLSLLGFDETRQMGVGFLKNFCAACLAGAIMMFIFAAYPYISTAVLTSINSGGTSATTPAALLSATVVEVVTGSGVAATGVFAGFLGILSWVAGTVLLIVGVVKSGSWAREVLGG